MDNTVVLNIGGKRFTTLYSTLTKIPNSRLGRLTKHDSSYDVQAGEYFFDRNPRLFEHILDCYRNKNHNGGDTSGELHMPHCACAAAIREELLFWALSESRLASCCWRRYQQFEEEERVVAMLHGALSNQAHYLLNEALEDKSGVSHSGWAKWRRDVLLFLEDPTSSAMAKVRVGVFSFKTV